MAHNHLEEAYNTLNPEQRDAVDTIEGPVSVIAGPGTGKTQILASRIGKILSGTDTDPEQILCLTYTEAGSVAMRKRLVKFIGPDAYRINIHTFHGFCTRVIQENPEIFGYRELEPVSELESIEVLKDIIHNLPAKNPLKRFTGNILFEISRLRALFSIMKKEDWSPEWMEQHIREYIEDLPNREAYIYQRANKGYMKGDLREKIYKEEVQRMELLQAAVQLLPVYQKALEHIGRFDFDDMIQWVLRRFETDEEFLLQYQEKFLYFLIDEYQDTNGSQNEIVRLLGNYFEQPNTFVVGDDDQSIYRFQGANMQNIVEFNERFGEHLHRVVLKSNYRSSQHILDLAMSLIDRNENRIVKGEHKRLKASNSAYANAEQLPSIIRYPDNLHEVAAVAHQIKALHDQGTPYQEMAVIYAMHKFAEPLARLLQHMNIPVNQKVEEDCLESPVVNNLLTILSLIAAEAEKPGKGDGLTYTVLNFSFFGLDPVEIQNAMFDYRALKTKKKSLLTYLAEQESQTDQMDLFSNGTPDNPSPFQVARLLLNWVQNINHHTLSTFVERIIHRSGLLAYVLKHEDRTNLLQDLNTFFDFVKGEQARKKKLDLNELLQTVELMLSQEVRLPVIRSLMDRNGVNLMTAHGSKGLEFEHVFLIQCQEKAWEKSRKIVSTYKLPDNLTLQTDSDVESALEEKRRLFYVAMTRAKKGLYLSFPEEEAGGREMTPSQFLVECLDFYDESEAEPRSADQSVLLQLHQALLSDIGRPNIPVFNEPKVDDILDNYVLSVTHMNQYLRCPLGFFFSYILKVPQSKVPAMEFGSSIHHALEQFFDKAKSDGKVPSVDILLDHFNKALFTRRDAFTEEEYKLKKEYANKFLPEYHKHYHSTWNLNVELEKYLRGVSIEGVPVNGAVDKVELNGKQAVLVDYKTGQHRNSVSRKNFNRPGEKVSQKAAHHVAEYGGDYWRQAVFYKLLLDADPSSSWEINRIEFDYVEPDSKSGEFLKQPVEVTPEDEEIVKSQIKMVHAKILNKEFDTGCGEEDCSWCNFVKSGFTVQPYELIPEEEE